LAEPSHPAARCGELLQLLDSNVDGGVGDATEGGALQQRAAGTAMTERGPLVVLFQRGAADGLDRSSLLWGKLLSAAAQECAKAPFTTFS